jgi:hypothetical protein
MSEILLCSLDGLGSSEDDLLVRRKVKDPALAMEEVVRLATVVLAGPRPTRALKDKAKAYAHAIEESRAGFGVPSANEALLDLLSLAGVDGCGLSGPFGADGGAVVERGETEG